MIAPDQVSVADGEIASLNQLVGKLLDTGLIERAFQVAAQYNFANTDLLLVKTSLELAQVRLSHFVQVVILRMHIF